MELLDRTKRAIEIVKNEALSRCVSRWVPILLAEGMDQDQAIAVAYNKCKEGDEPPEGENIVIDDPPDEFGNDNEDN